LAIVVAGRQNTSGPGLPGDWNDLGNIAAGSGGNSHGQRVGWKILTSTDIANGNVGSWSNANKVQVLVYRGAAAVSANHSGTGANSSTITFPARSSLSSGSWVVAVATHRSATNTLSIAATSYTNRSAAFSAVEAGGMDTNGAVSSVVQRTFAANASSGNVGRTMEVTEAAAPPAVTGSGGAAFNSASAGAAELGFTGEATASWESVQSGSADETFFGAGQTEWAGTLGGGSSTLGFIGDGAAQFDAAFSGDGSVNGASVTGNGSAAFESANGGDGFLEFTGEATASWDALSSGEGLVDDPPVSGEGALAFDFAAQGDGNVAGVVGQPDSVGGGRKLGAAHRCHR